MTKKTKCKIFACLKIIVLEQPDNAKFTPAFGTHHTVGSQNNPTIEIYELLSA